MKSFVFRYLQPATLAVIFAFWALAPADWVKNTWIIVLVPLGIKLFVQMLEFVNERHAAWRMTWREAFTDLFYVALGWFVIAWFSKKLAKEPIEALKHSFGIHTEWAAHMPLIAQVLMILTLGGLCGYWMHRLMHNQSFFWSTHAPHHHITQLNAFKGAVGNPIELFLIGLSIVGFFDLSKTALFAAGGISGAVSTFAHANVRFNPPRWYSFFFTTVEHHSLHHSTVYEETRCNYADSFILLDRLFGTFGEGEAEVVGQGERRKLSIAEVFLFPAQPVIDRFKARRQRGDVEATI